MADSRLQRQPGEDVWKWHHRLFIQRLRVAQENTHRDVQEIVRKFNERRK